MVPVILINYESQSYLPYVIEHARRYNQEVIFIGDIRAIADTSNIHLTSPFYISDYSQKASEFEGIYEHLNTNGRDVELFCFKRWFILEEFMAHQDIKQCLYIDSDVLLYANAENEIRNYNQFDFTLTRGNCGNTSFFKYEGLQKLCNFIMGAYSDKHSYEYDKITSHYHIRQKHGLSGGVCDMTLLDSYKNKNCVNIGEMGYIYDGETWDHNINESDGFEMKDGIKNIQFINKTPYCRKSGEMIRFNSLHLQGSAKSLIGAFQ